jgi:hypothetical protein
MRIVIVGCGRMDRARRDPCSGRQQAGKTFLPMLGTEFHGEDLVHLALPAASADRLKTLPGWT